MLDSISTFSFSFLLIKIGVNSSSLLIRTSTSGLLCLSTIWDEKFSKHIAAFRVRLTAVKYGFKVPDWKEKSLKTLLKLNLIHF